MLTQNHELSDAFSDHFSTIGTKLANEVPLERLPFVWKFRLTFSVKLNWYFFGTENRNGIELYHLQNVGKFFALSLHDAWH